MDVLIKMFVHHLFLVGEIVDRTGQLDHDVLDCRVEMSIEGIDRDPTLRGLTTRLVGELEMWIAAIEGETAIPSYGDTSVAGLRDRLEHVGPLFRDCVLTPIQEGRADETFVDATCPSRDLHVRRGPSPRTDVRGGSKDDGDWRAGERRCRRPGVRRSYGIRWRRGFGCVHDQTK
jgi:AraC family transcriptional regulator